MIPLHFPLSRRHVIQILLGAASTPATASSRQAVLDSRRSVPATARRWSPQSLTSRSMAVTATALVGVL